MSKNTNMPFKLNKKLRLLPKMLVVATLSTSVLHSSAQAAEQEWWFDIEVILFDRKLKTGSVSEIFKQSALLPPSPQDIDLLVPYLTPDSNYILGGLGFCRESRLLIEKQKHQADFAFPKAVTEEIPVELEENPLLSEKSEQDLEPIFESESDKLNNQTEDSFEYQVASSDIFKDEPTPDVQSVAVDNQATDTELSELTVPQEQSPPLPAPITVDWIEWQLPKQYPCAYAEQIEPSFESITAANVKDKTHDPLKEIKYTPVQIDGITWLEKREAFLLPNKSMRMSKLYSSLKRQRDISPLIHLAWRQKVTFGANKAQSYRLFAGKNYADEFNQLGLRKPLAPADMDQQISEQDRFYIPREVLAEMSNEEHQAWIESKQSSTINIENSTENLFDQIEEALQDPSPLSQSINDTAQVPIELSPEINELNQLWQIDGNIKVYLKNVGRVPYLHIDSNLDYRRPVFDDSIADLTAIPLSTTDKLAEQLALTNGTKDQLDGMQNLQTNFLQSANFNQLRRVISKQVHYFDHPLFGMIVRIHRYKWPAIKAENKP